VLHILPTIHYLKPLSFVKLSHILRQRAERFLLCVSCHNFLCHSALLPNVNWHRVRWP